LAGWPFFTGFYLLPRIQDENSEKYPLVSVETTNHTVNDRGSIVLIVTIYTNFPGCNIIVSSENELSNFEFYLDQHFSRGTIVSLYQNVDNGKCLSSMPSSKYVGWIIFSFLPYSLDLILSLLHYCIAYEKYQAMLMYNKK
jgi:hypothetical protein